MVDVNENNYAAQSTISVLKYIISTGTLSEKTDINLVVLHLETVNMYAYVLCLRGFP